MRVTCRREAKRELEWAVVLWGLALRCRALGAVGHGWTTGQPALRGAADVERAGWDAIGQAVGVTSERVVRLSQVHGAAVHVATSLPGGTAGAGIAISDLSGPCRRGPGGGLRPDPDSRSRWPSRRGLGCWVAWYCR